MVSQDIDIVNFFDSTQKMGYEEVILFAEQEALRAERMCLKCDFADDTRPEECQQYADCLKKLIFFLRYGIRRANISEKHYELFQDLCHNLSKRKRFLARCGPKNTASF
jgi:hypothetical protein